MKKFKRFSASRLPRADYEPPPEPMSRWQHVPRFTPHEFSPQVAITGGTPQIHVSFEAYRKMWLYVCASGKDEISWLGTVREDDGEYFIDDVWLLKQTVTSVESEITEDGLHELANQLLAQPGGEATWNQMRFWGHYHPFNSADPSSQDEAQLREFLECGHEFFIRGIACRGGQIKFTIYLIKRGIIITDVPWILDLHLADQDLRDQIAAEVAEKVRRRDNIARTIVGGMAYPYDRRSIGFCHGESAASSLVGRALDKFISRHQTDNVDMGGETDEAQEPTITAECDDEEKEDDDENSR